VSEQLEIPSEEFAARRERAREIAQERGLNGLLVWSRGGTTVDWYGDVLYLSNYVTPIPQIPHTARWSGRGHTALILPIDSDPVLIVEVPDYPKDQVQVEEVRWAVHVPQLAAQVLKERGLDRAKLGLVGRETLLQSSLRLLQDEIGRELSLEPADDILERLRMVKSEYELKFVRHAATVGAGWLTTTMEAVEPGKTEGEFVGEGLRFLAANGGYPYDVAVGSGRDCFKYFGQRNGTPPWEVSRPIQRGDIVHVDTWGPVHGYFTDIARTTVAGGKATEGQRELFEQVQALVEHIVAAVKPGATTDELYQRGAQWLRQNGFGSHVPAGDEPGTYFGQLFPCFGHGVGLGVEAPWIIEGDTTVVEPGMVLAVEFFMDRAGIGAAKYERNLLVTDSGHDYLDAQCQERWW
jgi:Xaa-Pro aminopeptidase